MASRAKPSSREVSVPVDTVKKERIIDLLYQLACVTALLARDGRIVIGPSTRFGPVWT